MRHSLITELICRALGRAGVAAIREPSGLVFGTALRPDGATLIPWVRGKCLAWDATTPDTLAASHINSTGCVTGSAAMSASQEKTKKYSALSSTHIFVPVAVETPGPWNDEGLALIAEIGRRTSLITADHREAFFLFQRISFAVQRGNAAYFTGSLPKDTAQQLDNTII